MSTTGAKSLTPAERQDLTWHEECIRMYRATLGAVLRDIRDWRLYRETHRSFAAYFRERWKFSKQHVDRLIRAAAVAENLGKRPGEVPERQARELFGLDPEDQRKVYERASVGGESKAARLKEAREAFEAGTLDGPRRMPLEPRPQSARSNCSQIDRRGGDSRNGNSPHAGDSTSPAPSPRRRAESLIEQLRDLAAAVELEAAGPLLDRLLRLFQRAARRRPAAATA